MENITIASRADGLPLSVSVLRPEGEVRALVQLSHGMAEHKERYFPLMQYLADAGFACMINDHRGHGASVRSADDLGYFYKNGDTALVDDLHQLNAWFRAQYPVKKLILVGHSMGSFAARAFAAKYGDEIDVLILSGSPGYNAAAPVALALIAALIYYSSVTVRTIFQAVPGVALAMLIIFGARYGLIWLYYRLGAFKYSSAEYHSILNKSKK